MTDEQISMIIKRIEALEAQHLALLSKSREFLSLADGFHVFASRLENGISNKLIDIINIIEDLRREVDSLK